MIEYQSIFNIRCKRMQFKLRVMSKRMINQLYYFLIEKHLLHSKQWHYEYAIRFIVIFDNWIDSINFWI